MTWKDITNNDYGWTGKITVQEDSTAVDISSYTTLQFVFKSPSREISTVTASFDTDGTDGVLSYVVQSGDIDEAGTWTVYARILKTGVELTSQPLTFLVDPDPN